MNDIIILHRLHSAVCCISAFSVNSCLRTNTLRGHSQRTPFYSLKQETLVRGIKNVFYKHCVMWETLQKMPDVSTMVKHVFLTHVHRKAMEKKHRGMQKFVLCERPLRLNHLHSESLLNHWVVTGGSSSTRDTSSYL